MRLWGILQTCHWIGVSRRNNRKPRFLQSKGFPSISSHPVVDHWHMLTLPEATWFTMKAIRNMENDTWRYITKNGSLFGGWGIDKAMIDIRKQFGIGGKPVKIGLTGDQGAHSSHQCYKFQLPKFGAGYHQARVYWKFLLVTLGWSSNHAFGSSKLCRFAISIHMFLCQVLLAAYICSNFWWWVRTWRNADGIWWDDNVLQIPPSSCNLGLGKGMPLIWCQHAGTDCCWSILFLTVISSLAFSWH